MQSLGQFVKAKNVAENYSKSEGKSDHFTPYLAGFTNSKRFFSPVDLTPQKLKFCLVISLLSPTLYGLLAVKIKSNGEKNDERRSFVLNSFCKSLVKSQREAIKKASMMKKPLLKIELENSKSDFWGGFKATEYFLVFGHIWERLRENSRKLRGPTLASVDACALPPFAQSSWWRSAAAAPFAALLLLFRL